MDEIQSIIVKLKRPYPLFKIEIQIVLASILHAINGIAWSITYSDWQYFERSGSIVVIVGVLLAWRDVTGKIDWFKTYTTSEIESQLIESKSNEKGIIGRQIEAGKQEMLINLEKELKLLLEFIKNRIRFIEATILVTGTFIWGYGCIIGNLVYEFA